MIGVLSVPDASALAAFFAAAGACIASMVGVRRSGRVEKTTKPNGGEALDQGGTMADALMRIESQVERHSTFTAEQFEAMNASLRAGGERMARIEATAAATREDVAGLRSALGTEAQKRAGDVAEIRGALVAEAQRRAGVEARLSDHLDEHHRTQGDSR